MRAATRILMGAAAALPLLALLARGPAEALAWATGARGVDETLAAAGAILLPATVLALVRSGRARRLWRRMADPIARVGLVIVVALHLVAVFAPLLAPQPPQALGDPVADRYQPPSIEHWLGTDVLGRDLYSRVVHGAQVSLGIALASVALSLLLGVGIGAVAGWAGGWLDGLLMRFTDLVLAFPRIFLVLLLVAFVTPGPIWIVLVLGATGWMGVARLVRGSVLQLRGGEYVLAARSLGLPGSRILLRHVLPGAIAPVIAASTLRAGNTVLAESFLSFLGLGITDPSVSWGMLIRSGRDTMLDAWWVSTFPGLAIVLTVVGWNLLGDGLRDAYDRRLTPLAPRED